MSDADGELSNDCVMYGGVILIAPLMLEPGLRPFSCEGDLAPGAVAKVIRPSILALAPNPRILLAAESVGERDRSMSYDDERELPGSGVARERGGKGWKAAQPSPPDGMYITVGAALAAAQPPFP